MRCCPCPCVCTLGINRDDSAAPAASHRSYPDLLEGFAPRQWPNFFVAGVGQVRYGVGPFVTALAETIACSVRTGGGLACHAASALCQYRLLGTTFATRAIARGLVLARGSHNRIGLCVWGAQLRVQTRLRSPVGRYLYLLGARPLTSYLMDPIAMFTKAMLMLRVLPWLPVVDRWMGAPAARATTKA